MTRAELFEVIEAMPAEELRWLGRLARVRLKVLALQASNLFMVGEKVRFIAEAHPSVLSGARAVVVGVRNGKVIVDMTPPVGRWGRGVRCPASILRRVA